MTERRYRFAGNVYTARLESAAGSTRVLRISQDDTSRRVAVEIGPGSITIGGVRRALHAVKSGDVVYMALHGETFEVELLSDRQSNVEGGAGDEVICAPMPGQVISVHVRAGERVQPADTLLVLESMKLHSNLSARSEGVVVDVAVQPGATVVKGEALLRLAPVENGDGHAQD